MKYGMLLISLMLSTALFGCSNTIQGVQKDAQQNAPIVQAAAQEAGQQLKQVGKTTDQAVTTDLSKAGHSAHLAYLATQIKARLIIDKRLNHSNSAIKVEPVNNEIALSGHVTEYQFKSEADDIALSVIEKANDGVGLKDQIVVQPS